ncbi:helix-turn-helix domain-containing protein [Rhodococcus ruber]|uniref:Putative GAF sensor protein n=1 Tax=Rhodococcus ruber TaxID=1830 RepID=A0A098BWB6_9NOCA|nr:MULTISPECIES: helix-turn-helix domain-containing protein [Rhodococcus]MCD2128705.1 helix-turn-helix domain-containing protein [Rhodococcus ruber]MCZ4505686.1 helix-turn-helix domain-containing protein [Rhodococcus ruber]MCZ4532393.1 helix-turn-helix domain-containing protein [Rhodococcus ruber]MCZ4621188.1 helix-turn-helix domain-containing protein [Rhodococcus ruber]MDI9970240.1 helix-turn-helix domain-containing protein [Rhodococcus ruber]
MPVERSGRAQYTDILTALRDIVAADSADAVLRAALTSARATARADAAFWMDAHADGLRMVAGSGLSQPEAHALSHIPPDRGLGGQVLRSGGPVSTPDYGADPRAIPRMRQLLEREGLVSAAAVPVSGAGHIDSVLYVVSRARRPFESAELRALAGLASMAGELRGRAAERARVAQSLRTLEDDRERTRAERELFLAAAESMLTGAGVDHCLELAGDTLGGSLHLDGPNAGPAQPTVDGRRTTVCVRQFRVPGTGDATLTLRGAAATGDDSVRVLAALVGMDLARHRAALEAEIRLTDHLVRSLLDGSKDELRRLWHRALLVGLDLGVPRAVVAVGGDRPVDRALLDTLSRRVRSRVPDAQLTTFEGDAFVLWPLRGDAESSALATHLATIIEECRPHALGAGIGPVCRRAEDYPAAVREARFALRVGVHGLRERTVVTVESLGMYRLFAHVGGVDAVAAAAEETLAPVLRADSRDGSDLLHTLQTYLEKDRRAAETARALHVHVNTLRYRIERVGKLLRVDLDDPDARFFLLLALRLSTVVGRRDGH